MEYGNNYKVVSNLAQRIRDAAAEGKSIKVSSGLASRDGTAKNIAPTKDINEIRATYMNYIQDMFGSMEAETRSVGQEQLTYGLPAAKPQDVEYSMGREFQGTDFLDRLIQSESSGNPQASYTDAQGRSYVGLVQIGEARLADYNKATGSSVEQADIVQNAGVQNDVIQWHMNDLTKLARKLSGETGMSVQGLVAVGHLGGRSGMTQFANSGGEYNKSDALGTSLMDYYTRFKN